jgi:excinuclease ABC subunit A
MSSSIHIKGARTHNLRGLEVHIPRDALTVICGVSGSGKSSLAFDTLYAEGYRKYIESLSTHARQLMEQLPRPEVDFIHGLSPVIAVEQENSVGHNPRSTVGTVTEIADYARLLWSIGAEARCPLDGGRILKRTLDDWVDSILEEFGALKVRAMLAAPWLKAKPSVIRGELAHLQQRGWERLRINGKVCRIDEIDSVLTGREALEVEILVDRFVLREDQRSRVADSLEMALREGDKQALLLVERPDGGWDERVITQDLGCENCGAVYPPLTAKSFSWNHPAGACRTCGGVGQTMQFAPELVVPNPQLAVRKGAIKPWRLGSKRMIIQRNAILKQLAEQVPFDPNMPWEELDKSVQKLILHGTDEREFLLKVGPGRSKPVPVCFDGVLADLENSRRETSSEGFKARLMAYQVSQKCQDCEGRRLNPHSRAALLGGEAFDHFMRRPLSSALGWAEALKVDEVAPESQLHEVVEGLRTRLRFLVEVGLGYLSLDRSAHSLSGGESQRVRLASQLGMGLVGVTYVLDEPTVGLHGVDAARLLQTLLELKDRGNTVVVVEHEEQILKAADYLIEIGPGAGAAGGEVVVSGTPSEVMKQRKSPTGAYLSGAVNIEKNAETLPPVDGWITVRGAEENNLQNIDVSFPVGLLTAVSGVSGSGKSTLVNGILGQAAAFRLQRAKAIPGRHRALDGLESFERVIRVDQEPIGRSPRSNPATYTKLFDELRKLYAQCSLAKVRGYGPSRFSFNVRGGRCERCQGDGQIRLDMQFLSDVFAECPSCGGARYNRETLEVRFKGLNIAEVLALSVDEAAKVFAKHPKIHPAWKHSLQSVLATCGSGRRLIHSAAGKLSGSSSRWSLGSVSVAQLSTSSMSPPQDCIGQTFRSCSTSCLGFAMRVIRSSLLNTTSISFASQIGSLISGPAEARVEVSWSMRVRRMGLLVA